MDERQSRFNGTSLVVALCVLGIVGCAIWGANELGQRHYADTPVVAPSVDSAAAIAQSADRLASVQTVAVTVSALAASSRGPDLAILLIVAVLLLPVLRRELQR